MPVLGKRRARRRKRQVKKRKRFTRRKPNFRLSRSGAGVANVLRIRRSPLTQKLFTRFVYQDVVSVNPGALGVAAAHIFRGSSLFDPDLTGIGHQPTGFDQLLALYSNYTVVGTKIHVTFINNVNANYTIVAGISLASDSTPLGDYKRYIENGNTTHTYLERNTNANDMGSLSLSASYGDLYSIGDPMDYDMCRGTASTNPAANYYFHVWCAPPFLDDASSVGCYVTMEFIAVLTNPTFTALS